jgi:hypothetical protein
MELPKAGVEQKWETDETNEMDETDQIDETVVIFIHREGRTPEDWAWAVSKISAVSCLRKKRPLLRTVFLSCSYGQQFRRMLPYDLECSA